MEHQCPSPDSPEASGGNPFCFVTLSAVEGLFCKIKRLQRIAGLAPIASLHSQ